MVSVVALLHGLPGAYGVSFPDFPGCIAGGETLDEALERGRDGLQFHVESMIEVGEALPKIRDVAEIKADQSGSLAARRSIAAGSSFQSSFPGTVVPPPARARRDSRPATRATAISAASGIGTRKTGGRLSRATDPPDG